jgi:hypothetical protein
VAPAIRSDIHFEANIYRVTCTGRTAFRVIQSLYAGADVALPRKAAMAADIMRRFAEQYREPAE